MPWAKGQDHSKARLVDEDIPAILELYEEGQALLARARALSVKGIAAKYDVTPKAVGDIIHGRTWTHLTGRGPKQPEGGN